MQAGWSTGSSTCADSTPEALVIALLPLNHAGCLLSHLKTCRGVREYSSNGFDMIAANPNMSAQDTASEVLSRRITAQSHAGYESTLSLCHVSNTRSNGGDVTAVNCDARTWDTACLKALFNRIYCQSHAGY